MSKKLDLSGRCYGKLIALKPTNKRKFGKIIWLCRCKCGNEIEVPSTYLTTGETKSCGCLKKELDEKHLREKYNEKRVNGVAMQLFDSKPRKTNTTGYRGVQRYYTKKGEERFKAYITVKGKRYSKSGFKTAKEAYYIGRLELEAKHLPDRKDDKNENDKRGIS